MKIVNLTKGPITILGKSQETGNPQTVTIQPSRTTRQPRVKINREVFDTIIIDSVEILLKNRWYGREVANLPPRKKDTYYIVSRVVADATYPDRPDFLTPDEFKRSDISEALARELP